MSLAVSKLVWENFAHGGTVKLALLCLAYYAEDDGGRVHPSIGTVARRLTCSESQARRAVHRLLELGVIHLVGNKSGGAPGATRRYRIDVERLRAGAFATPSTDDTRTPIRDASPSADARGGDHATRNGSHACALTPGTGDTRSVIELPKTRKEPVRAHPLITFRAFLDDCRKAAIKPIPENDPVWQLAERMKLPADLLHLCWKEFHEKHLGARASRRQRDWRQAFRNCVRDNWYRLWYIADDGTLRATGAARMSARVHAAA